MKTKNLIVIFVMLFGLMSSYAQSKKLGKKIETRIGTLNFTHDFENGYPSKETVKLLFDEMDFQRACQLYIWSIPLVSFTQWQNEQIDKFGAKNGDIVYYKDYADKNGLLTANATTPYVISFVDLKDGPVVIEIPKAQLRGALSDMWQIALTAMVDEGKYLFYGPGQEAKEIAGYKSFSAPMNNMFLGVRLMSKDEKTKEQDLSKVKIYPYKDRNNPKPPKIITPNGKHWEGWQPRGLKYWEVLSQIINKEPVREVDRYFMAMLKPLGIEKGKPFNPTSYQKKILEEATIVGEAMAKANDFYNPRLEASHYAKGSHWEVATVSPINQRWENYNALDGAAAWFYEAVTNDPAMQSKTPGKGQIYLAGYLDKNNNWLDGAKNYKLHVLPNPPVAEFWSVSLYDIATRCLIDNGKGIADRSSRMDLLKNKDGSIDIYIGPDKPKGKEQNWIPTVPGKSWFAYFRFYSPTETYFDRTWLLSDFEEIK